MNSCTPDVNYTILPFPDSVVQRYPDQVRAVLEKEARVRRPIVVTTSAAIGELCADVVLVTVEDSSDSFEPEEIPDMTSEDAFETMVGQVENSDLASQLDAGMVPVVSDIPDLKGHAFGFDNLDARAGIVAAALTRIGATSDRIRIKVFGDLPGVFSADPRIVEPGYDSSVTNDFQHVCVQPRMSFREALELSTLSGPKAFTSGGLVGLDQRGIQLQVRSICDLRDKGTRVLDQLDRDQSGIRFISGKENQMLYVVSSARMAHSSGIASLVLKACEDMNISVTATFGGGSSFPFTIDADHPRREELEGILDRIGDTTSQPNVALVSCIGTGMKQQRGLSQRITSILDCAGINIEEITTSADRNFTVVVQEDKYEDAIIALHRELIECDEVGR